MTEPARRADALLLLAVGLAARLGVVAWAGGGAMPGDAEFYRRLAGRIAEGHGYTWLWPDGAVTAAAHYPVGWPALLAGFDGVATTLSGGAPGDALRHPWAAQAFAALVSAFAAPLIHATVARAVPGRRVASVAGALVALHPGLVLYAPALMTEGPTATLLALLALLGTRAAVAGGRSRWWWLVALGVAGGAATLVRPQSIVIAPLFAAAVAATIAAPTLQRRLTSVAAAALLVSAVGVAICAPWTARNCREMGRCALVSMNGGWNLLIGSEPGGGGGWAEVQVPPACRTIWDEAGKDACFGQAARERIAADPVAFARRVPAKLSATFDYAGAGPWWLAASRPDRVGGVAKLVAAVVETAFERLLLLACVIAVGRARPASVVGRALVVVAGVAALQVQAWVAFLALAGALASLGVARRPPVVTFTALAIAATAGVHAVFFGAGRYQLVLFPLLAAVGALALAPRAALGAPPADPGGTSARI